MFGRLAVRIAIPMVVISILLLGLGVVAAWKVQSQQVTTQNLVVNELEGVFATQNVYKHARDILSRIHRYLLTHDEDIWKSIAAVRDENQATMRDAERWPRTPEEQQLMAQMAAGYSMFWTDFDAAHARESQTGRDAALDWLANEVLTRQIIEPAELYMGNSRRVVARANDASRRATELTREGFLLLGLCGCAGGLIAGWVVARSITHSLVRLDISVRGVADRLGVISGPVTFTREGGLHELLAGLAQMEQHIVMLVKRLQDSELQVLRSEQLAAVGQLAAGVAHELRNPLMPIKMLVQSALERGEESGLSRKSLIVIEQEIQRLEQSIQNFLDFARPQIPAKTEFDLAARVRQALELVSARAHQQGVVLNGDLPEFPIVIEADPAQIQQVLLNLLLNALDALPDGGAIDVALRVEPNESCGRVVLEIADNGPGLQEEVLARIFEPFVTTKETGTGLGLSICQRLIEGHGGSITGRNRVAGGAVFSVRLPLHEATLLQAAS